MNNQGWLTINTWLLDSKIIQAYLGMMAATNHRQPNWRSKIRPLNPLFSRFIMVYSSFWLAAILTDTIWPDCKARGARGDTWYGEDAPSGNLA